MVTEPTPVVEVLTAAPVTAGSTSPMPVDGAADRDEPSPRTHRLRAVLQAGRSRWDARLLTLGAAVVLLATLSGGVAGAVAGQRAARAGTASSVAPGGTARPSAAAPLASLVLQLDQVPFPGFTIARAPKAGAADDLGADDAAIGRAAAGAHLATASYFRPTPSLATANGPVDTVAVVALCADPTAAATLWAVVRDHWDRRPGASAISSGSLGDQSHATLITIPAAGATPTLVEVVLLWRQGPMVNLVLVRGRDGGTGIADALAMARPQQQAGLERATA